MCNLICFLLSKKNWYYFPLAPISGELVTHKLAFANEFAAAYIFSETII